MGGSYVAALVAFFVLIVGSAVVSGFRGAEFSAFSEILFGRAEGASVLKMALAWGWVMLGLAAVAGAFMAFVSEEDEDGRRRIPVAAPLLALAGSFGLLWAIFAPAPYASEALAFVPDETVSPTVEAVVDVEDELAGGGEEIAAIEPVAPPMEIAEIEPVAPTPAEKARIIEVARPLTTSAETGFYWTYEYPLIRDDKVVSSPEVDRALARFMTEDDKDGAVATMLCGKAWVAFSGSASEEGPPERNAMRARARAELVAARAESWLDAHPSCERPVIVALDLGQHNPTSAGDPATTAYQRQLIVISRARASGGEIIDAPAAVEEMRIFYGNEGMRTKLLGARHYRSEAAVFIPT